MAGEIRQAVPQVRRGHLDDVAAGFANQKNDRLFGGVAMAAGEIGVARGEPMYKAVLKQEVERAIDRDRRRALAGGFGDAVDHLIGAERAALRGEDFQNAPPARRQRNAFPPAKG